MQTENPAPAPEPGNPKQLGPTQLSDAIRSFTQWWREEVTLSVDKVEVIARRRAECQLTARYLLMITMSAGIAILGLLLSSPAVVIGAMLLSPLMDPIMGIGFALAVGDFKWLRQSARNLAIGAVFAVAFCALVVLASPIQTITSEIAARTRPSLFDLLVAIFSAVAGAYAMIRGREGTIVGVAIATALMPPLAVVGFGLATWNWTVFSGALLLFVTNLAAIALTGTAMARLYGFSSHLSEKQTLLQTGLITSVMVALAVPLGLATVQIGWETQATRQMRSVVLETFDGAARISQIEPNFRSVPLEVSATVLTTEIVGDAERRAALAMRRELGREVTVSLTQIRVGTTSQAAEQAQLTAAREQEEASVRQASNVAEWLGLLAGVPADEVTVDRAQRRALVTARALDGATLSAYEELERRIDALQPEWDIRLTPPPLALPAVPFAGDELGADGPEALRLIAWAQRRTGLPVRIAGPADAVAAVAETLAEAGVSVETDPGGTGYGTVRANWVVQASEN